MALIRVQEQGGSILYLLSTLAINLSSSLTSCAAAGYAGPQVTPRKRNYWNSFFKEKLGIRNTHVLGPFGCRSWLALPTAVPAAAYRCHLLRFNVFVVVDSVVASTSKGVHRRHAHFPLINTLLVDGLDRKRNRRPRETCCEGQRPCDIAQPKGKAAKGMDRSFYYSLFPS